MRRRDILWITVISTIPMAFNCAKNIFLKSLKRRAVGSIRHSVTAPPIFIEEIMGKIRRKLAVGAIRQGTAKEPIGPLRICCFAYVSRKTNNATAIGFTILRKVLDRFCQIVIGTRTKFFKGNITGLLKQSCVSGAGARYDKCQADCTINECNVHHHSGA